jgi:hypothetical protein
MRSRRSSARLCAALAGLAAILFAQVALALAACNLETASSRALALSMASATEPCHEQAPATDTLCAAHCLASDPALDKYQGSVPVLPAHLLPVLQVRVVPYRAVSLPPDRVPAAAPPARILFQSLLI